MKTKMTKVLLAGVLGIAGTAFGGCELPFGNESHEHTWEVTTTPPTCTEQGFDEKTCSVCGKTERDNFIEPVEHTVDKSGECTECKQIVGSTEGIVYQLSWDNTYAEVVGYEGDSKKICIADSYEGVPVKSIAQMAFYNQDAIRSVTIPDTVLTIEHGAFADCKMLTSVVIGDGVQTIDENAFYDCLNLASVVIGKAVSSIDSDAFKNCKKLVEIYNKSKFDLQAQGYEFKNVYTPTSGESKLFVDENDYLFYREEDGNTLMGYIGEETELTLPSDIKGIHPYAFVDNDELVSVVIPDGLTEIAEFAFYNCNNLKNLTLPSSIKKMGNSAFRQCTKMCNVYITDLTAWCNIENISECTVNTSFSKYLYVNGELITELVIPEGVTKIDTQAFFYFSNFTSVVIGKSVTTISASAFAQCSGIRTVTVGNSVTTIESNAFFFCTNLQSVTLSNSVTTIRRYAFGECRALKDVYYKGNAEEWANIVIDPDENTYLLNATKQFEV